MAEHTRKFYTCDRCGVEMDQPVRGAERGPTAFTLRASQDCGVAGGVMIGWDHLCESCNTFVAEEIRRLADGQRTARRRESQSKAGRHDGD